MGIDYYQIKKRDDENHMKKLNNKSSECNTRFDDTYHLYKYNIGIYYYHIKNRDKGKANVKNEKSWIIKVMNVKLDLMTLTDYTNTIIMGIDIITLRTEMKRFIQKWKQLNNKSSECNTRFDEMYLLYKYNIVIDYHHIKKINEKSHTKVK